MQTVGLCVDIGGTKTAVALFGADGAELGYERFPTCPAAGAEDLVARVYEAVCGMLSNRQIRQGVIAAPGPLDSRRGILLDLVTLGWKNVKIIQLFEDRFQVPFSLLNDCDAGALGVWRYGGFTKVNTLCYISVSTGVGGGIVVDGKLLEGKGNSADFGHLPVPGKGLRCRCGWTDCLELYASGSGIEARYRERTGESVGCEEIAKRAQRGEAAAAAIFAQAADKIAYAVDVLQTILDPEIIVFGGSVCKAGKQLFQKLDEQKKPYVCAREDGKQVLYGAFVRMRFAEQ